MRREIVSILYCVTSCVKVLKVEKLPCQVLVTMEKVMSYDVVSSLSAWMVTSANGRLLS